MGIIKSYSIYESENVNIDDYENFISKWKRSGGYISKNTIKKMDEIGLRHDQFTKIIEDIDRCYSFFDKNDMILLSDLLLDAFDECPIISEGDANYSFGIHCRSINYGDKVSIDYPVSFNSENKLTNAWTPSTHDHFMDKDILLENLTRTIIEDRNKQIEKEESELANKIKNKDKHYWIGMNKSTIKHLKSTSPFRSLQVNPVIYIDTIIGGEEPRWPNSNTDIYQTKQDFMRHVRTSIIRYLSAIGYNGFDSRVSVSEEGAMAYQEKFRLKASVSLNN